MIIRQTILVQILLTFLAATRIFKKETIVGFEKCHISCLCLSVESAKMLIVINMGHDGS